MHEQDLNKSAHKDPKRLKRVHAFVGVDGLCYLYRPSSL